LPIAFVDIFADGTTQVPADTKLTGAGHLSLVARLIWLTRCSTLGGAEHLA